MCAITSISITMLIIKEIFSNTVDHLLPNTVDHLQHVSLFWSQIQLLADLNLKKTPQLAELVADDNGKV